MKNNISPHADKCRVGAAHQINTDGKQPHVGWIKRSGSINKKSAVDMDRPKLLSDSKQVEHGCKTAAVAVVGWVEGAKPNVFTNTRPLLGFIVQPNLQTLRILKPINILLILIIIFLCAQRVSNAADMAARLKDDTGDSAFAIKNLSGTVTARFRGDGTVGIGTTTPQALLEVQGSGAQLRLSRDASNYTNLSVTSAGALSIQPSAGEASIIGNVGIGTTTPSSKLHVLGTVTASAYIGDGSQLTGISTSPGGNSVSSATIADGSIGLADMGSSSVNSNTIVDNTVASADILDGTISGSDLASNINIATTGTITTTGSMGIGATGSLTAQLEISGSGSQTAIMSVTNTSGSSTLYVTNAGDIGIGTITPQALLEVQGSEAQLRLSQNASNYTDLSVTSAGALSIQPSAGEASIIGNVGIGTTTPGYYKLNIYDNSASYARIQGDTGNSYEYASMRLAKLNNYWGIEYRQDNPEQLWFTYYDGSTWKQPLILHPDGNVGIGTSTPQTKLHVIGTVTADRFVGDGSGLTNVLAGVSSINSDAIVDDSIASVDIQDYSITGSDLASNISISTTGTMSVAAGNFVVDSVGSMTASVITTTGSVTASSLVVDDDTLYVDSSIRSVGIGTSTIDPSGKLTVGGNLRVFGNNIYLNGTGDETWSDLLISLANTTPGTGQTWGLFSKGVNGTFNIGRPSADAALTITTSDKIGLGTSTPQTELHVIGTVTATAFIGDGSQLTGVSASPGGDSVSSATIVDGSIGLADMGSSSVNGNVIVDGSITGSDLASNINIVTTGTMSVAGGNFVVDSSGSVTAASVSTAGTVTAAGLTVDTNTLYVDSANNRVGIGTITPQTALHIVGTLTISGNDVITDASDTSNTFLGAGSGNQGITGSYNTAYGAESLTLNTTGEYNTAIGYNALLSNTTGYDNTAIGESALYANIDGDSNTAVGASALRFNIDGQYNTATGGWALYNNTTGYRNTANGYYALYSNNDGFKNTANGHFALYSNTSGEENTAYGMGALQSNTAGNFNTSLGAGAGYSALGSNNVFIGYQAGYSETGSNKLYIANGSSNTLIYGNFGSGTVGIGTTTPSTALVVVGTITATSFVGNGSQLTGISATPGTNSVTSSMIIADAVTTDKIADGTIAGTDLATDISISTTGTMSVASGNFVVDSTGSVTASAITSTGTITIGGALLRNTGIALGTGASTHVNLGVNSTTGTTTGAIFNATVAGGSNNTASGHNSTIGGGIGIKALSTCVTVAGGSTNTASSNYATVSGGLVNTASGTSSTVGGGNNNIASEDSATIGGGEYNTASSYAATVGGGDSNTASGDNATIGGGDGNTALAFVATVGGGYNNTAAGDYATVGGGGTNTASGYAATVGGGDSNTAAGDYSWAGGRYMQLTATADNTFVWGTSTSAVSIGTADAFLIFPNATGATGRAGIGTSTPQTKLHVIGTVTATGFVGDGSGLTGITATPGTNSVTSSMIIADAITTDKIADGTIAGADLATDISIATTGTMSVANGNFVVDSSGSMTASAITTTGTLTASGNLNIDSGTLFVDSVNNRVGVGTITPSSALQVIGTLTVSGNNVITDKDSNVNTFIGVGAGNAEIGTGTDNTAFGFNTLSANTSGYGNTANGYQSLYSNTTGYFNTAYGNKSLNKNTTGYNNTANGHFALWANTTGNFNTAYGDNTLFSNISGNSNTAGGKHALLSNTTGNNNTSYGAYSLDSNTIGSDNTAIGYQAGSAALGSGNVFLGNYAGYNETGTNTLYIANGSSTTLIYGNFGSGTVGIGTITPSTALVVVGTITATQGFVGDGSQLTGISASPGGDSVSSATIADGSISLSDMGTSSVNSDTIVDGSIAGSDLASNININTTGNIYTTGTITTTGGVGIGTTGTLTAQLEIGGTGSSTAIMSVTNTSGSSTLYVTNAGNVGIGTTTPSAKLAVAGDILVTGTVTIGGAVAKNTGVMLGTAANTHVNLGINSTTGTPTSAVYYATVSGGYNNTASGPSATVGGGMNNKASYNDATVSGGSGNTASGDISTVGGGQYNTASNDGTTVAGGGSNVASGYFATVGGGYGNTAAGFYSWSGGQNMQLSSSADNTFVWGTATSAFSINTPNAFLIFPNALGTTGKVGIGTSTPNTKLHVLGTVTATAYIGDGSQLTGISASPGGNSVSSATIVDGSIGLADMGTSSVNSNAIVDNTVASTDILDGTIAGSDLSSDIEIATTGAVGIGTTGTLTAQLEIVGTESSTAILSIENTSGSSTVYVTNAGNVGIGTTTPSSRLMVIGSSTSGNDTAFSVRSGSTNDILYVKNDGRIGIGTTTPSTALHIVGTVTAMGFSGSFTGDGSGLTGITSTPGASSVSSTEISDGSIALADMGTSSVNGNVIVDSSITGNDLASNIEIATTGAVGIGTTGTLTAQLEIAGTGSSTAIMNVTNTSGSSTLYVTNAGNVGIGTTTPSTKLHIVGTMTAMGNLNVDSGTLYVDSVNNFVGIGTTTPSGMLYIKSAPNYHADLIIDTGAGINNAPNLYMKQGGTTKWRIFANTYNGIDTLNFADEINNQRMILTQDGNVGIGTSTPNTKLHVLGTVTATTYIGDGSQLTGISASSVNVDSVDSNSIIDGSISLADMGTSSVNSNAIVDGTISGDDLASDITIATSGTITTTASVGIGTTGTLTAQLEIAGTGSSTAIMNVTNTSGSSTLYVTNAGNIGIGTTTPSNKLEIFDNAVGMKFSSDTGGLKLGSNNSGVKTAMAFYTGNTSDFYSAYCGRISPNNGNQLVINGGSSLSLQGSSSSGDNIYINNSGNVGIGTTTPSTILVVNGTVTAASFVGDGSQLTGITASVGTNTVSSASITDGSVASADLASDISIFTTGSVTASEIVSVGTMTVPFGDLIVDSSTLFVDSSEDSVGIGTTTPTAKLAIVSYGTSTSTAALNIQNASGTITLYANDAGHVGIGTNDPTALLEVDDANTGGTNDAIAVNTEGPGNIASFNKGWVEKVVINNNGYVGIGTNTPSTLLHVIGTVTADYFSGDGSGLTNISGAWSTNGSDVYRSSGSVGIGTTTPLQKLHVEGQCVTGDTLIEISVLRAQYEMPEGIAQGSALSAHAGMPGGIARSSGLVAQRERKKVPIKDLLPGMEVYTLNEETRIIERRPIKALLDMGIKPVFELITKSGKRIKTTGNHPYLIKTGGREYERKFVSIRRSESVAGQCSMGERSIPDNKEFSRGREIWSDQSIASGKRFDTSEYSRRQGQVFEERIRSVSLQRPRVIIRSGNLHENSIRTAVYRGENISFSSEKLTPDSCESSSPDQVSKGLKWVKVLYLLEGDEIATYCPDLSTLRPEHGEAVSKLSALSPEHDEVISEHVLWEKIVSISYLGYQQVYDIEVEGTHNFIANEIFAHNTYINGSVTATGFIGDGSGLTNLIFGTETITAGNIATGAITTDKLAVDAVTSAKIADGTISLANMGSSSVNSSVIVDGSITLADMGNSSVDSAVIVDGSIASIDIANGTILGEDLAADINISTTGSLQAGSATLTTLTVTGSVTAASGNFIVDSAGSMTAASVSTAGTVTVSGGKVLTDSDDVSNTFLGIESGMANTTGNNNTAYGYQALYSNTAGTSCTAIGAGALYANSDGYQNTAVGDGALTANTTGSNNAAFGSFALFYNTTGYGNTAVGDTALSMNTTGYWNTAVGDGALYLNGTGTYNTAVGGYALSSNTSGSFNTSVGMSTLSANTTGDDNTAVGYMALDANTTGDSNTANGSYALYSNTTGSYNTAIGDRSLYSNTTGVWNTAVGNSALYTNTTGTTCTALGFYALRQNTTGNSNTAAGYSALYNNTTGDWNTAYGAYTMYAGTGTGNSNTAIGGFSLYNNADGSYNTVVGDSALYSNTDGGYNTVVGAGAGYNATGTGSVFIGYQAGYNETGSNKLHIANNSSNTLIYGDFSTTRVGIGTTTPSSALHVVGTITSNSFSGDGTNVSNVTAAAVVANGVTSGMIATDAVGSGEIVSGAVGSDEIADNTIASADILDGTIAGSDLASDIAISTTGTLQAGSATVSTLTITGSITAASGAFVVDTTGSMTAANISATGTMTISGKSLITDTSNTENTFIGVGAGNSNASGGLQNSAYGYQALYSNTTGDSNVANGYQALYSNTLGGYNTALGYQALYSSSAHSYNTAVGYQALYSNTGAAQSTAIGYKALYNLVSSAGNTAIGYQAMLNINNISQYNTAIGYNAMYGTTTLNNTNHNVAVGRESLYSITSGTYNTAIGNYSLYSNTTGDSNVANGYYALYSNTTGTDNVAVGERALQGNTTGNYNAAVGNFALYLNTTGYQNTAIGGYALYGNTTGLYNVANGYNSLYSNVTGSYNAAIGYRALYKNKTGDKNSVLGYSALDQNVSGSNNTAIGQQAGYLALGSGNVFLGYRAGYNETGTNTLYIANDSTNTLIYGNFGSSTVGIGTTTPSTALHVIGTVTATAFIGDGSGLTNISTGNDSVSSATIVDGSISLSDMGTSSVNSNAIVDGSVTSADIADSTITGNDLASDITIATTGTITTTASVGIGTTGTLTAQLEISGTGSSTAIMNVTNTSGSSTLYVTNAGNIGIGTVTPQALLEVQGSEAQLRLSQNASNYTDLSVTSAGALSIQPSAGEASIIGNVGIGTTTPSTALHVIGTITASAYIGDGSGLTNISTGNDSVSSATIVDGSISLSDMGTSSVNSGVIVDGSITSADIADGTIASADILDGTIAGSDLSSDISISTTGTMSVANGNFVVDSSGSMTASTISTAGTVTSAGLIVDTNTLYVDAANNRVGIGTITPQALLEAQGSGAQLRLSYDGSNYAEFSVSSAGALSIQPSAGEASIIGTITISGNNLITDSGETSNTFIGVGAGNATTGTETCAFGYGALASNNSGYRNTANGPYALYSNTTGYKNTANGAYALSNNTTGYQNTANGASSLLFNTTGSNNTANGFYALYSNTTGNQNTANGGFTLFSNTTGLNNTANGYYALYSNDTGYQNTANGRSALHDNTTGYNNTANGYYALYSNTTGYQNTAIGLSALGSSTTGYQNTAVGYGAGLNALGSGNVFLGYQAGLNETGTNTLYIANSSSNTLIYGNFGSGTVGIGTTTPSTALHVIGTVTATVFVGDGSQLTGISASPGGDSVSSSTIVDGSISLSDMGTSSVNSGVIVDGSVTSSDIADGTIASTDILDGTIAGSDLASNISISTTGTLQAGSATVSTFTSTGSATVASNFAVDTNTLYVDAANNRVGIGTTTPATKLQIIGDGDTPSTASLSIQSSSGSSTLYVNDFGKIGIGTSTPSYGLDVWKKQIRIRYSPSSTTQANSPLVIDTIEDDHCWMDMGSPNAVGNYRASRIRYYSGRADEAQDFQLVQGVVNEKVRFHVGGDGRLGIGTTTPNAALHVIGTNTASVSLQVDNSSGTTTLYVTESGYVGIGTTTPSSALHVVGTTTLSGNVGIGTTDIPRELGRITAIHHDDGSDGGSLAFSTYNQFVGITEHMRIVYGGQVGIGTTTPTALFQVGSGIPSVITESGTGTMYVSSTLEIGGEAYKPGGGSWASASDKRLKKNINHLSGALDKITQLNGVTFEWANPENHGNISGTQTGLIAQEVEAIFPEWIAEVDATGQDRELIPEGEKVKTLKFPHGFNAYVIEAIKELKIENDALKMENDAMRVRLAALEKTVRVQNLEPVQDVMDSPQRREERGGENLR